MEIRGFRRTAAILELKPNFKFGLPKTSNQNLFCKLVQPYSEL